jgi:CRP-like cAMP-binding protein
MTDERLTAIEQQAQATLRVELACEADGEPVSTAGILARMLRDVCADLRAARAELAALRPTAEEVKAADYLANVPAAWGVAEDGTLSGLDRLSPAAVTIAGAIRRARARKEGA